MSTPKKLVATAALAVSLLGAFAIGRTAGAGGATGATSRTYTLRIGDRISVPAIGQACSVSTEGGAMDLFCSRAKGAHHQVAIFRDSILVWKVGDPDHPAWSGKT